MVAQKLWSQTIYKYRIQFSVMNQFGRAIILDHADTLRINAAMKAEL